MQDLEARLSEIKLEFNGEKEIMDHIIGYDLKCFEDPLSDKRGFQKCNFFTFR